MKNLYKYVLFIVVTLITSNKIFAQQQNIENYSNIKISPAIVEINAKPGQIQTRSITIGNSAKTPIGIKTYLGKVTPKEAEGLEVELQTPDWLKISEDNVIVQAGSQREIQIIISPDKNTPPGSYFAIAYFEAALNKTQSNNSGAISIPKVGALILINIDGKKTPNFEIQKKPSYPLITGSTIKETFFLIRNKGNVHVVTKGNIAFYNLITKEIQKIPLSPNIVLPLTTRSIQIQEKANVPPGIYDVELIYNFNNSQKFSNMPLQKIIVLGKLQNILSTIAVLLLAIFIKKLFSKRKNIKKAIKILKSREV